MNRLFSVRRVVILLGLALLALAIPAVAVAASPHFIYANGSLNNDGTLTASFKEAGLGTNQNINYELRAFASATWVCVNNGGSNPSAQNKTTVSGPVVAPGTFNSGKNGAVIASLTLDPPPSNISCPKGQKLELAEVTYTNVTINDISTPVLDFPVSGGPFASGCLLSDVKGACS